VHELAAVAAVPALKPRAPHRRVRAISRGTRRRGFQLLLPLRLRPGTIRLVVRAAPARFRSPALLPQRWPDRAPGGPSAGLHGFWAQFI